MKLVHFTFNNFFDYQLTLDNLNKRSSSSSSSFIEPEFTNSNELQLSFVYLINEEIYKRFM